jgi:long-chain fatty acid transport protein
VLMKAAFIALYFLSFSISLFAGGFQINLLGQKQTGMGHTGTALSLDASSMLFNPGSLGFLSAKYNFSGSANFIRPFTLYQDKDPGNYYSYLQPSLGTPFSACASAVLWKDKLSFGLGIYTPFGSSAAWEDDWKGSFIIQQISLQTIFVQPTLSYRVSEKLGIGAGFVLARGEFGLKRALPLQDAAGAYGSAQLRGSGRGYGYNLGIYYSMNDRWQIGLNYRSSVMLSLEEGTAEFTVPTTLQEHFPSGAMTGALNLPGTFSAGIAYKASEKLLLALDLNWIGWSVYDTLRIDLEKNTERLQDIQSPKLYANSYIIRLGAQYQFSERYAVRLGGYFDKSPVPDAFLGPETPDVDKIGMSSGASIVAAKNLNIDISFLFIEGFRRTFENTDSGFSGSFKSRAWVAGIGLTYNF